MCTHGLLGVGFFGGRTGAAPSHVSAQPGSRGHSGALILYPAQLRSSSVPGLDRDGLCGQGWAGTGKGCAAGGIAEVKQFQGRMSHGAGGAVRFGGPQCLSLNPTRPQPVLVIVSTTTAKMAQLHPKMCFLCSQTTEFLTYTIHSIVTPPKSCHSPDLREGCWAPRRMCWARSDGWMGA